MGKPRCLIAMSGGVDSSVAAALMLETGYDCEGITMKLLPCGEQGEQACLAGAGSDAATGTHESPCDSSAESDAALVCSRLGIPHHCLDLADEFSARVIEPFVEGYVSGSTPNPCIECNRHLKFSTLLSWARREGFECLATGHYARIEDGRLFKARDLRKDQSYVLYTLTPQQLRSVRLPLGGYKKEEVRRLAKGLGLASAHRQESQDICFVPDGDYVRFIEEHLRATGQELPRPGDIVAPDGTVVGSHNGIHCFTIGQRRGLGISGREPYYVLDIDAAEATVRVGTEADRGRRIAFIDQVEIMDPGLIGVGRMLSAKHRYRGREHPARVFIESDNTAKIVFFEKQPDLTKGQALVMYDEDCVICGGTIAATE